MGIFLYKVLRTCFFFLWWENIHESCKWSSDGCCHIAGGVISISAEASWHWPTPLPVLQANPFSWTEQVQTCLTQVGELLSNMKLACGPLGSRRNAWITAVISCAWKTGALEGARIVISRVLNILIVLTVWNLLQSIIIIILVNVCKLKCPKIWNFQKQKMLFMILILSALTVVVTDGGESCPLPRDGAVPLGWAIQSEPFLAGEALRSTDLKPLVPGPNITVIQLELSRTQNVWKLWVQLKF